MVFKCDITTLRQIYKRLKEVYEVISPVYDNGVIQYRKNPDFDAIPFGKAQMEYAGSYFVSDNIGKYFSYVRPYNTLKNFLRPAEEVLYRVYIKDGKLYFESENKHTKKPMAFFDVRKCDLKALSILDEVFINKNNYPDEYYKELRENLFIVAVNCSEVSDVCFCSSMNVNFNNDYGSDIVLTELKKGFLLEVKTDKGKRLLEGLSLKEADEDDLKEKNEILTQTYTKIKKSLNKENLKEELYKKINHPYWEEIGNRCLGCTSCTQVCPTCFCFDIIEKNSLDGSYSERVRIYDSCFNPNFATVHKFNLRDKIFFRYRHWLLHKMAYWQDQFDDIGCVGCGRCITWCPAKIDIEIETNKVRDFA
ncbi:4Fe-4S dicluster domain-containing protein [Sulfurihydrogenibium subterraneum]|uniref:4Fe-4S dicluster domain-containing protein n=1 Tax=Sulfurihydrogenibium subterraneum TaxID=171121 RepID=UPI00048C3B51|nr:4Fe-4S dicluster domain-containing protein [Sulfurihydrogenibium subterraneum]